jgi:hypothetical protein
LLLFFIHKHFDQLACISKAAIFTWEGAVYTILDEVMFLTGLGKDLKFISVRTCRVIKASILLNFLRGPFAVFVCRHWTGVTVTNCVPDHGDAT